MKLKLLTIIGLLLLVAPLALGFSGGLIWNNLEKDTTITNGDSIGFTVAGSADVAPLTIELKLRDYDSGAVIKDYGSAVSINDPYDYSQIFTVTPSDYKQPGKYLIQLVVSDARGNRQSDRLVLTVNQKVIPPEPVVDLYPTASASATPISGDAPLTVQFTGTVTSGNLPLTYSWNFRDNTAASTLQNPSHIYQTADTYTAVFTVTDSDGDSSSDTVTITVTEPEEPLPEIENPTASFTVNPTTGATEDTFYFDASASHDNNDMGEWTEECESADVNTDENVNIFDVVELLNLLKDQSPESGDVNRDGKTNVFDLTRLLGIVGSNACDESANALQYQWDYGDGKVGGYTFSKYVQHIYSSAGEKTITLTVKNSFGKTASTSRTITVTGPPQPPTDYVPHAEIRAEPTSGDAPLAVKFTATARSHGNFPLTYRLAFGNGEERTGTLSQSGEFNIDYTYQTPRTSPYNAVLTVTDADRDSDSTGIFITVNEGEEPEPEPETECNEPQQYTTDRWDRVWCRYYEDFGDKRIADIPDENSIQFDNDWGAGDIVAGLSDNVGFKSKRSIYFDEGTYEFTVGADDGMRLWVDEEEINLNIWNDRPFYDHTRAFTLSIPEGYHNFRMYYYEHGKNARVMFSYKAAEERPIVPQGTTPPEPPQPPPPPQPQANQAPIATIDSPSSQTINTGSSLIFSASDSDSDGTIVQRSWTFGGSGIPDSIMQDPGSRTFNNAGTFTITYTVWDDDGATASNSVVISVTALPPPPPPPGNQAPILNPIGNKVVTEGQALVFTVSATDSNNDPLTFTVIGLPLNAIFDQTLTFSWIPALGQASTYSVTFAAADPSGATDSETILITVLPAAAPPVSPPPAKISNPQEKMYIGNMDFINGFDAMPGEDLILALSFTNNDPFKMNDARVMVAVRELGIRNLLKPFDVSSGETARRNYLLHIPEDAQPGEYTAVVTITDGKSTRIKHRTIRING